MLVILRENVENLGRMGDMVHVSSGFARNYLIPNRLVVVADEGNKKMIENQKKIIEKKRLAARADSELLAKSLTDVSVTLLRKTGEQDKLFGSVSAHDISEALQAKGYQIEKRMIQLDHPIKALGDYEVKIHFDHEVEAKIKVSVAKEA